MELNVKLLCHFIVHNCIKLITRRRQKSNIAQAAVTKGNMLTVFNVKLIVPSEIKRDRLNDNLINIEYKTVYNATHMIVNHNKMIGLTFITVCSINVNQFSSATIA